MERKPIDLRWPSGGVFKRARYADKPPVYCEDALNVRPDDTILGRERGGKRPGLVKAFAQQLGSGNPIKLLTEVTYDSSGITTQLIASSNGSLYRNIAGTLTVISSAVTLASDTLSAVDIQGKLYLTGDNTSSRVLSVFDPVAGTLANATATAGTLPTKCRLCALHADRLWLAGDENPGVWYASRAGDPLDFDYTEEDIQRAVSATNSRAGHLANEKVQALMTYHDDCLVIGMSKSIWVMRGNPAGTGGNLVRVSNQVGVHGAKSWAFDAEGWLWMWTPDGLYVMPPGCGSAPMSVSRELLPESLVNVDRSAYTVTMAYDFRDRGLHLFVSKNSAGATTHYWVDTKAWQTGDGKSGASASFWPMSYQSDHEPFALHERREVSDAYSQVMIGCRDGYVRRFQSNTYQDDSSNITSYVFLGPFPGDDGYYQSVLNELTGEIALNSADVTWTVHTGNNPEAAFAAAARETGTWTAGVNYAAHPRVRGSVFYVKLAFSLTAAGAFERATAVLLPKGRRRV